MATEKKNRILDIFYRAIRGEKIKVVSLAGEYEVSEKVFLGILQKSKISWQIVRSNLQVQNWSMITQKKRIV